MFGKDADMVIGCGCIAIGSLDVFVYAVGGYAGAASVLENMVDEGMV